MTIKINDKLYVQKLNNKHQRYLLTNGSKDCGKFVRIIKVLESERVRVMTEDGFRTVVNMGDLTLCSN